MKAFRFWIGGFEFHSDQTGILAENTGIATSSLGETRTLRFRKIDNQSEIVKILLLRRLTTNIQSHRIYRFGLVSSDRQCVERL